MTSKAWRAKYPDYDKIWRTDHPGYEAAAAKKVRSKWTPEKRQAALEYQHAWKARLHEEVYGAYGGKCACCGETEPKFFMIDHVNGDGAAHRRSIGVCAGFKFYLRLRREGFPKDPALQILCTNCSLAKERGGCPHVEAIKLRSALKQIVGDQ